MKLSPAAGFVLMALMVSCYREEKPLTVPELREVHSVRVLHMKDPVILWEREIKDPKRIEALLACLRKNNTSYRSDTRLHDMIFGWRRHEYGFVFKGEEELPSLLILQIGPNWLGGTDFQRGEPTLFRYRRLGASELEELLAIVLEEKS